MIREHHHDRVVERSLIFEHAHQVAELLVEAPHRELVSAADESIAVAGPLAR